MRTDKAIRVVRGLLLLVFTYSCISGCKVVNAVDGHNRRVRILENGLWNQVYADEAMIKECAVKFTTGQYQENKTAEDLAEEAINSCGVQQFKTDYLYAMRRQAQLDRKPQPTDANETSQFATNNMVARVKSTAAKAVGERRAAAAAALAAQPTTHKQGTGFFVSQSGLFVTSEHVIEGSKHILILCANKDPIPAEIITSSVKTDLVVLQISRATPEYLSLAPLRSAKIGQHVFTIGFPISEVLGRQPKFTDGAISALSGMQDEQSFLQISVPVQPGNSGGPLINDRGEVVGIIAAQAQVLAFMQYTGTLPQNVNWAVKADYAATMFDAPPKKPLATSTANAIDAAQRAVCIVDAR